MITKKIDMNIGIYEMSIPINGITDESLQAIACFIDNIEMECERIGCNFSAKIMSAQTWNATGAIDAEIAYKIENYLSMHVPVYSDDTFIVNDGTNMPLDAIAQIRSTRKPSERAFRDRRCSIVYDNTKAFYTINLLSNMITDGECAINLIKDIYPIKEDEK